MKKEITCQLTQPHHNVLSRHRLDLLSRFLSLTIVLTCFLVVNQVMHSLEGTGIGVEWFYICSALDLALLIPCFALKELRLELSLLVSASVTVNSVTAYDFINYTNHLIQHYSTVMPQIYYGCLFALAWGVVKVLIERKNVKLY